jgi:flagellar hook-length control protein FliK
LETETEAARTAIVDNLPALRDRLNEQGVRIERFDVDLMQRQPGGMPDQTGGRHHDAQERVVHLGPPERTRDEPVITSANQPLTAVSASDGLNVII